MNLDQLNKLAAAFNINPADMTFHGEHDVVYIDASGLPDPDEFRNLPEEEKDQFSDTYGIWLIEGYWGFFT
jgi:hypothetical protein